MNKVLGRLVCGALVLGVVGCAGSKPVLEPLGYAQFASSYVALPMCVQAKKINTEQSALAREGLDRSISGFDYETDRLEKHMNGLRNSAKQVPDVMCVQLAEAAATRKLQREVELAKASAPTTVNTPTVPIYQPRNTYCNKIGTQVFCNTY